MHKTYEKHNIFTNTNIKVKYYWDTLKDQLTTQITQTFFFLSTAHQGGMICFDHVLKFSVNLKTDLYLKQTENAIERNCFCYFNFTFVTKFCDVISFM